MYFGGYDNDFRRKIHLKTTKTISFHNLCDQLYLKVVSSNDSFRLTKFSTWLRYLKIQVFKDSAVESKYRCDGKLNDINDSFRIKIRSEGVGRKFLLETLVECV